MPLLGGWPVHGGPVHPFRWQFSTIFSNLLYLVMIKGQDSSSMTIICKGYNRLCPCLGNSGYGILISLHWIVILSACQLLAINNFLEIGILVPPQPFYFDSFSLIFKLLYWHCQPRVHLLWPCSKEQSLIVWVNPIMARWFNKGM